MACGQQVLNTLALTHNCALLAGYNQGPSRYQKSAKLTHLSIQPARKPFVKIFLRFVPQIPLQKWECHHCEDKPTITIAAQGRGSRRTTSENRLPQLP